MQREIQLFSDYLMNERRLSEHTVIAYTQDLQEFALFIEQSGGGQLKDLVYQDMRLYLISLNERQLSKRSIARKLSTLRTFFKYALLEQWIQENPMELISFSVKSQKLPEFLYEEEMEQLLKAAAKENNLLLLAVIEVLYASGMRVSECCNLKLSSIDWQVQLLRIIGKGNKERIVPLGDLAMEALRNYVDNERSQFVEAMPNNPNANYVFITSKGKRMTPDYVRKMLNQFVDKYALNLSIHPHKFRHTFATHLLNNGADMRSVQELLGHANLSSTQIYTHVTKDQLRQHYLQAHPRAKRITKEI